MVHYGYENLKRDLSILSGNKAVSIQTAGKSLEGRELYYVTAQHTVHPAHGQSGWHSKGD